jgi:hypothetical protein
MVWNTWQNPMLETYAKGAALAYTWFFPIETFDYSSIKTDANPIHSHDMCLFDSNLVQNLKYHIIESGFSTTNEVSVAVIGCFYLVSKNGLEPDYDE